MQRTQVLLEEWQYEYLKNGAEQEGVSLSEVVRRLLRGCIPKGPDHRVLNAIEGIGRDAKCSGREHARFLYGKWRPRL